MAASHIIDTFPAFLAYWETVKETDMGHQIETWTESYLAPWPELLRKQLDNYAEEGSDWQEIAREHVFPYLAQRLPDMALAHRHLLENCLPVSERVCQVFGFEAEVVFVIYVGIGCGAGWADSYRGQPAVLFGLENIAEEGWSRPPRITGLIAHELGHLTHFHWRERAGLPSFGDGPWWQLYAEGIAQWCEHQATGSDSWHMKHGPGDDWLDWCRAHRSWLAAEFLRRVDAGETTRSFFGSWHNIEGRKQTGYFLGHELIAALVASQSLREIALVQEPETVLRPLLETWRGRLG
jgi:hypothetical protein